VGAVTDKSSVLLSFKQEESLFLFITVRSCDRQMLEKKKDNHEGSKPQRIHEDDVKDIRLLVPWWLDVFGWRRLARHSWRSWRLGGEFHLSTIEQAECSTAGSDNGELRPDRRRGGAARGRRIGRRQAG
jgi:hypothetical protein